MILEKLELYNFRNYENVKLNFSDGIHLITGKNAQGKTNLLEAILYLSTTRSHRTNDDCDLVLEGSDSFFIKASTKKARQKVDLRITVNEKGKNLFVYNNPIHKVSDFIGEFNAVMFCPDDMILFHASPKVRRRFVDMELSKISRKYVGTLYVAQKLLKERNSYLKQVCVDKDYLDVITQQLIDVQLIIMKQRFFFLRELLEKCRAFYTDLSMDQTILSVRYESCVPFSEDEQILKEALVQKYRKNLDRDIAIKQTSIGIHKEDFIFLMDDKEIASYASQGQKRSVLLAMKIGIIHMIQNITHEFPVLLLDDVFSELDEFRRKKLLDSLPKEVQIFITTTDTMDISNIEKHRNVSIWTVEYGNIDLAKEDI